MDTKQENAKLQQKDRENEMYAALGKLQHDVVNAQIFAEQTGMRRGLHTLLGEVGRGLTLAQELFFKSAAMGKDAKESEKPPQSCD